MVAETKIQILDALEKHSAGLHLRGLTKEINGSFPNIRRFVLSLEQEGIVKTESQGNLTNITLNDSFSTSAYLKLVHTSRFLELDKNIQSTCEEIFKSMNIRPLIFLLFGDCVEQKNHKNSADILLVFQDKNNFEKINESILEISKKYKIKINLILLDYLSFEKGLLDNEDSISKKIRRNNIIVSGVEYYYASAWRFLRR